MSSFSVGTFGDMIDQYKTGVYDFTTNGKCCCCGACCSNILPMTRAEIKIIKLYIAEHDVKEHRHVMPLAKPMLDMTCPFMDDSKELKCTIYEVRPSICRQFLCSNFKENKKPKRPGAIHAIDVREEFFGGRK